MKQYATLEQITTARDLARKMGVERKYTWFHRYWTTSEIMELIRGFRKRLGFYG